MTPTTLSAQEVADKLGVCTDTVYRTFRRGELPGGYRVGRKIRFLASAIDAYMAGGTQ